MAYNLPIDPKRDSFLAAVQSFLATVLLSPTGSGKSTRTIEWLLATFAGVILIFQPRRVAAFSVAQRVATMIGEPLGRTVGYQTGKDRQVSNETRAFFVTEELGFLWILNRAKNVRILVLDEFHGRTVVLDLALALAREWLAEDPDRRLIIMSATIDPTPIRRFLGGDQFEAAIPIVEAEGRPFNVVRRPAGRSMQSDVASLIKEGHNVLIFVHGVGEIRRMERELIKLELDVDADIFHLHGEMSRREQRDAIAPPSPGRQKIVIATPIAEAAITIESISAVVDSGFARVPVVENGIFSLTIQPISKAESKQREGRAGRTEPPAGVSECVYISHCPLSWDEQDDYPAPHILVEPLESWMLRLAAAGRDLEKLELLTRPSEAVFADCKLNLRLLGLFDDDNRITKLGRQVATLPVRPEGGRMVVEALKYGGDVLEDMMTIAAIIEIGGITRHENQAWRELCKGEATSDLLAQLQIFKAIKCMQDHEMRDRRWTFENEGKSIRALRGEIFMRRFSETELRRLRNEIPVRWVIETLLQLPQKEIEGVYRFLCPLCGEFQTGVNPHSNLGRCFRCCKNFNPIELVMSERGLNFVESVNLLRAEERCRNGELERRQRESAADVSELVQKLTERFSRRDSTFAGD